VIAVFDPASLVQFYADLGWHMLPLGPRGKRPHSDLIASCSPTGSTGWSHLRSTAAPPEVVAQWLAAPGGCNLGVIIGSDFAVVDCDNPEKLRQELTDRNLAMPRTWTVATSRGFHFYFRSDGQDLSTKAVGFGELRAAGSYVVLPPSVHLSGQHYEWIPGLSPADRDMPVLPDWLGTSNKPERSRRVPYPVNRSLLGTPTSSNAFTGYSGDDLRAFATREDFAIAAAQLIGIEAPSLRRTFRCLLPGQSHTDTKASATIARNSNGAYVYHDHHEPVAMPLAQVYAAVKYGRIKRLSKSELATWMLRLLVDTGLVAPAEVPAASLPVGAPDGAKRLYRGFLHLLACKWLYEPGAAQLFPTTSHVPGRASAPSRPSPSTCPGCSSRE